MGEAAVRLQSRAGAELAFARVLSTSKDGRFETDSLDGTQSLDVWASKAGYASARTAGRPGEFLVLRLPNTREIRGRVVESEAGHGIPAAAVFLMDRSVEGWPRRGEPVTTDEFGEFALVAPRGALFVNAAAVGYLSREIEVGPDADATLRIAMEARGRLVTLVGTVRSDGEPASDVGIAVSNGLLWDPALVGSATRSHLHGAYRLERVPWPPNVVSLSLVVDGGPGRSGIVTPRVGSGVERNGEVALDLSVPASVAFEGAVTDQGRSVVGARVAFVVGKDPGGVAVTDALGFYRLTLDTADQNGFLRVRTPDGLEFQPRMPDGWLGAKRPVHVDAAVPPSGRVRVHVVAPVDGYAHPLAGARVEIGPTVAFTGADGSVEVPLLVRSKPSERYTLDAYAMGYLKQLEAPSFWVEAGVVTECRTSMFRGGRVAGRVVDAERRPIGGAQVEIVPTKPHSAYPVPVTLADGTFDDTAWGEEFRLNVSHPDFESVRVDGVPPDSVIPDILMTRRAAQANPAMR